MPDWLISLITHPITLLMLGGGVGANARYWLGIQVRALQGPMAFPWVTFFINVSGSVVLGFAASAFRHNPDATRTNWYLLLGTGFCGGYTTFSTFSLETMELIQEGRLWAAVAYTLGSVVAGVFGVWLALKLSGGRLM